MPDRYIIVLVGTDKEVDKILPKNVISIHRTQDQQELAEIYSAADVFINPTKEDNYPTVHMEALACGTPVLTFNTGGAPEMLTNKCGSVIEYNNINELEKEIYYRCEDRPFKQEDCLEQAKQFDENMRYQEYLNLYKSLL